MPKADLLREISASCGLDIELEATGEQVAFRSGATSTGVSSNTERGATAPVDVGRVAQSPEQVTLRTEHSAVELSAADVLDKLAPHWVKVYYYIRDEVLRGSTVNFELNTTNDGNLPAAGQMFSHDDHAAGYVREFNVGANKIRILQCPDPNCALYLFGL